MSTYKHPEAYCRMSYANGDRSVTEVLWNSRDGVTPYGIGSADGTCELLHVDWNKDKRDIFFVPPVGSRVFIDLTMDAARAYRRVFVEKYWEKEIYGERMCDRTDVWTTKEEAVEQLAKGDYETGGVPGAQPDVVVVDERLHKLYRERADALLKRLIPNPRFT